MTMRTGSIMTAVGALPALARDAAAHEGHGNAAWHESMLHYVMEPAHLVPMLAALVTLVALAWAARRVSNPPAPAMASDRR